MPKFSPTLKTQLDAAPTKLDWANTLKATLGNTRRLRCWRDANGAATDPASTGTEFLNVGMSGAMTITAGNITGFGTVTGTTVKQAADLSSGAAVMRIEGNGAWVEYTLGLTGSGKEFTLPASPTAATTSGFAFGSGAGTKAPVLLDSGTGPLSSVPTPNAPRTVDIEDWSSGSAVVAGTLTFDTRMLNMVYDDPDVAQSMGDVRVYYSANTVTWGGHEWGALLWVITPTLNYNSTTEPVYEVAVGRLPVGSNWANYPAFSGYVVGVSDTFCPAHKVTIRKQGGALIKILEQRDSLPVSDPSLRDDDMLNNPVRPHMNCGQMFGWSSVRTKEHPKRNKWFNGYKPDALRPTSTRSHYATNQALPLINAGSNCDGVGQWFAVPKWPFAENTAAYTADTPSQDPNLWNFTTTGTSTQYPAPPQGTGGSFRLTGWGYEPAAQQIIDRFCGPGGSRNDRYGLPTTLAIYYTDPSFIRPRGGEAIRDMFEAWNMSYFNLSHHYITSAQKLSTLSLEDCAMGIWGYSKTYYSPNDYYVPGGMSKTVPQFAIQSGSTYDGAKPHGGAYVDKNNRMPWNGDAVDFLHNYTTPAFSALFECSPMLTYMAKHRLIAHFLCQLGADGSDDPTDNGGGVSAWFLFRRMAWRHLQLTAAWKITGDHELMISRKTVEDRFQRELEAIHDYAYKKTMVDNVNSPFYNALRNLGAPCYIGYDFQSWGVPTGGQTYYETLSLMFMKQYGLWDVMRAKSAKCRLALDFIIRCLDLASIDFILDTDGRVEGYGTSIFKGGNGPSPTIYSSWAEFGAANPGTNGQDWITGSNGIKYSKSGALIGQREQNAEQHNRFQYVSMRMNFITEADVPCARPNGIALAYAKYKNWYDIVAADVANGTGADWTWRWAPCAELNPPPVA